VVSRHLENIKFKIGQTSQKYQTLDTFDFFEEQEESDAKKKEEQQKYLFANGKKDRDLNLLIKDGNIEEFRKKLREKSQDSNNTDKSS